VETVTTPESSRVERLRSIAGRAAFRAVIVGLSSGLALHLMHQPQWAATILAWTCGVLILLPVANVLSVLATEIRRRDWTFALLAAAVLLLLAYALVKRLGWVIA
jgi:hypothetical protein